jgi:hypothetical protein
MRNSNQTYYQTLPALHRQYREMTKQLAFHAGTSEDYDKWKKSLWAALKTITGLDRIKSCALEPRILEKKQMDGYERIKMIIQTEPEIFMPFYILKPGDMRPGEKRSALFRAKERYVIKEIALS